MKKLIIISIIFFFAFFTNQEAIKLRGEVSFNYFYANLAPYGEWIELDYNTYAWRPNFVHYDWRPYSVGMWSWTKYGWYWESYEPFGWATYHYGRWFYDDYYGWIWLPGYEWGPAWVEWRYNDDYIGWAPLPPYASFSINLGIHFSIRWHSHSHYWHFVRYNHFCHPNVNVYFMEPSQNYNIFSTTKYRTNYFYDRGRIVNRGVDRSYVERRSGSKIRENNVAHTSVLRNNMGDRSVENDRIEIFRPSDNEVNKFRSIEKYDFKKSEGRTSLRTDKVEVNRSSIPEVVSNAKPGIGERKSSVPDIKNDTPVERQNNNREKVIISDQKKNVEAKADRKTSVNKGREELKEKSPSVIEKQKIERKNATGNRIPESSVKPEKSRTAAEPKSERDISKIGTTKNSGTQKPVKGLYNDRSGDKKPVVKSSPQESTVRKVEKVKVQNSGNIKNDEKLIRKKENNTSGRRK